MQKNLARDHGGNLDSAAARFGGDAANWIDLSTGISPVPYPIPTLSTASWTALPDQSAQDRLNAAARKFWNVPDGAAVLATPGASAAIARIPDLVPSGQVMIPTPTYNEHAASFAHAGWQSVPETDSARVLVNPNNPDGRLWQLSDLGANLQVIDESFCDVTPEATLINAACKPGTLVLKSFGKFWGLAGLRLGFVIGDPSLIMRLADMLGPWPVSGPALEIGSQALSDTQWADMTRARLITDADRLDQLITRKGATLVGGTPLFRLYQVDNAHDWQNKLAQHHIWSRIFPYNPIWLRLGLPDVQGWQRVEQALA